MSFEVSELVDATGVIEIRTYLGYVSGISVHEPLDYCLIIAEFTPAVGSSAGSLIRVRGSGSGFDDHLNLQVGGQTLCADVRVLADGLLLCETNPISVSQSSSIRVIRDGTEIEAIVNSSYEQRELFSVRKA